jgi:hypothetical protein
MTKTEMLKAAQQDSEAIAALVEAIKGADADTASDLIGRLIAATRRDTADDIRIDLESDKMTDAAQLVKNEYL